jgi:hypothetical protein
MTRWKHLDWHHLDHHQITSTTITWNQDCPPWPAGSPHQGLATAATESSCWTPAGKGVKTVTQEYRPSKRFDDQEAGPIGGAGTWPVRPAAPGMTHRTQYQPNLWYRRENVDILISRHCTDIMYDIKVFTFDIVISRYCNTISYSISKKNFYIEYISSVQRRLKLNIVHDIDGFPPISKQYIKGPDRPMIYLDADIMNSISILSDMISY